MEIIKKHINLNYSKGVKITPKYIVIHETDNERPGADAMAHYQYWNTNTAAQSSTHFVVDDKMVVQLLEVNEKAWHVGDNKNYSDITNNNSIGIEICVNSDGVFSKAYENCIELVKILMKQTNIPLDRVVRHYDASGKNCPRNIIKYNMWGELKSKIGGNNMADVQEAKKFLGNRTKELQEKLVKVGYDIGKNGADGIFGQDTLNALKSYQKNNGLTPDGLAGLATFKKIDDYIARVFAPPKLDLKSEMLRIRKELDNLIAKM